MTEWIDLSALWRIVVVGLVAGAGLPALFAVGLRALGQPAPGTIQGAIDEDRMYGGNPIGLAVASACFAVVVAAVGWGIYAIVSA